LPDQPPHIHLFPNSQTTISDYRMLGCVESQALAPEGEILVLYSIAVVLLVLWLLGIVGPTLSAWSGT
jgi:hypothetical protein